MARVVMVHGIGHRFTSRRETEAAWRAAVTTGLHDSHLPELDERDIDVVAYGNCFRAAGAKSDDYDELDTPPAYGPADLTASFEQDLLAAISEPAAANVESKLYLPGAVQAMVRRIDASQLLPRSSQRLVVWLVKEVHRYLHEPRVRDCFQSRLASCIGPDTRVVVGHSLGSIAAYEALCAHREWGVDTLLTIGSPLGFASLGSLLSPPVRDGRGFWPNVRAWVNVAAQEDAVAIVKELAPIFGKVDDRPILNGRRHAHDAVRYLTSAEACDAIVAGLA
jgi:hypothetical protein